MRRSSFDLERLRWLAEVRIYLTGYGLSQADASSLMQTQAQLLMNCWTSGLHPQVAASKLQAPPLTTNHPSKFHATHYRLNIIPNPNLEWRSKTDTEWCGKTDMN